MDYMILKEDLNLMVEACYRVWHIDRCKRIDQSAENIRELITLHETWAGYEKCNLFDSITMTVTKV